MALTLFYVYEQDIKLPGWAEDGGAGMTLYSWYDHDLAGGPHGGIVIPVFEVEPGFFIDSDDVFFQMPPLTTEVKPHLFIEEDVFYIPMNVRALRQPARMLRNEVKRVR